MPEVFGSCFDVRVLMRSVYYLNDKKKLADIEMPWFMKMLGSAGLKRVRGTYITELMHQEGLI